MRRLVLILSFLGLIFGFVSSAYTQVIWPDKREIKLVITPGKEIKGSIFVENLTDKDVIAEANLEDFEYLSPYDGGKGYLPMGSTPSSCAKWINFSPRSFVIPAKSKYEVSYAIKVPKGVKGGYYAALFFQKSGTGEAEDKGISIVVRVASLFFLETPDRIKEAKLENISLDKDGIEAELINSGNIILNTQGNYYVMDGNSILVSRGDMAKYYIPSEKKVPLKIKLSKQIPEGKYTLFINFDLGEGKALIKEIDFSKDANGEIKILKMRD